MFEKINDDEMCIIITHEVSHYIIYLCCNIVPEKIEFFETQNGVTGVTLLNQRKKQFENINDKYTDMITDCVATVAGAFSAYLDFESKTILNKQEAIEYFNNSRCCVKDRDLVNKKLNSFYGALNSDKSDIEKNITEEKKFIYDSVFDLLEANAKEIKLLTSYIYTEIKKGKHIFYTNELNKLDFIKNEFGDLIPGYYLDKAPLKPSVAGGV